MAGLGLLLLGHVDEVQVWTDYIDMEIQGQKSRIYTASHEFSALVASIWDGGVNRQFHVCFRRLNGAPLSAASVKGENVLGA